jgi:hypothetical protein
VIGVASSSASWLGTRGAGFVRRGCIRDFAHRAFAAARATFDRIFAAFFAGAIRFYYAITVTVLDCTP